MAFIFSMDYGKVEIKLCKIAEIASPTFRKRFQMETTAQNERDCKISDKETPIKRQKPNFEESTKPEKLSIDSNLATQNHCAAAQSDAAVNSSTEMQQSAEVSIAASLSSLVDTFISNAAAVPACTLPADIQNSNSDFFSGSISDSARAFSQFVADHDASLLARKKFNVNPECEPYTEFLKTCKPAGIFVEDFCHRYETGVLGGEEQGVLRDALLSINNWMLANGSSTQLNFVLQGAASDTSSGKFFRDGNIVEHQIHFTVGEPVMAQFVCDPEPGTEYLVLHLDMWALSMTLPHAEGIPVVELVGGHNKAKTFATHSSVHHMWPCVKIGGKDCCVAQLLGLTQFAVVPRHPQHPQSHQKWINWGVIDGIFRTSVYTHTS